MRADFLLERTTDIVYHATPLKSLVNILRSNTFKTAPAENDKTASSGSRTDKNGKRLNQFCVSRQKVGGYLEANKAVNSTFVLDGDKFNHRYKSQPIDYFAGDDDIDDGKYSRGEGKRKGEFESEDRIFSKEDKIPDALKYVKAIHICGQGASQTDIAAAAYMAKKFKIPIFLYAHRKDWLTQNTKKACSQGILDSVIERELNAGYGDHPEIRKDLDKDIQTIEKDRENASKNKVLKDHEDSKGRADKIVTAKTDKADNNKNKSELPKGVHSGTESDNAGKFYWKGSGDDHGGPYDSKAAAAKAYSKHLGKK